MDEAEPEARQAERFGEVADHGGIDEVHGRTLLPVMIDRVVHLVRDELNSIFRAIITEPYEVGVRNRGAGGIVR
jgi:hypothetical protein